MYYTLSETQTLIFDNLTLLRPVDGSELSLQGLAFLHKLALIFELKNIA